MNLRLMDNPILLRNIVLLPNHLPSRDLESDDATKSGKEIFPGWSLMKICMEHAANCTIKMEDFFRVLVGVLITIPFINWKKETQRMKSP